MLIVNCPHCNEYIEIHAINCNVFRHAMYKNGDLFNQHAPKDLCEKVVKENLVYGCAKPFKIIDDKAVVCEYI